jgi:hypothetical protein
MSRILRWLGREDQEYHPPQDVAEQDTLPLPVPALPRLPVRLLPRSRTDRADPNRLPRAPRRPPGGTAPRRIVLLCGSSASTGLLLQQEAAPYLYEVGAKPSNSGLRWTAADGSIIQFFSVRAGPMKWITAVSGAVVVPLYRQDESLSDRYAPMRSWRAWPGRARSTS